MPKNKLLSVIKQIICGKGLWVRKRILIIEYEVPA